MTEFKFIPVDDIRKWWASVRPGLEKIKSKSPENWIVEDVYTDCFNQKAMLWVVLENNHFNGFFILQPMGEELHVWAAWTLENDYQVVQKGLQFIKNMAREANVKYLTFSSHRPGWDRRAKAYGFRPRKWISEV
jgi:hypothetical protein